MSSVSFADKLITKWPALMSRKTKTVINMTEHFPGVTWYAWSSSVDSYEAYETIIDAKRIFQTDTDGQSELKTLLGTSRTHTDCIGCIIDVDECFCLTNEFKTIVTSHRTAKLSLIINGAFARAPPYCVKNCDLII
jgi:hypothetical protein